MHRFWTSAVGIIADRVFLAVTAVALVTGGLLWHLQGGGAVLTALHDDIRLFMVLAVFVPAVLLLSAVIEVMMPPGLVERWIGARSGLRGIVLATLAGMFTPGGPFVAFPLVLALLRAGADYGALVAYVTAWSLLSVFRVLVFEIPFTGIELPAVRFLTCFFLPVLVGVIARALSQVWRPPVGQGEDG
jgi:uncharacterized membrane protein YraQ (UPF0718 family)